MPLPHDAYINDVTNILDDAGLSPADSWTSEAETRGTICHLSAVITLDSDTSNLPADLWPEGLLLIWEWHTGLDSDTDDERGPIWLWAKKNRDGSNSEPAVLPVDGYACPVRLLAAVGQLTDTGKTGKYRPGVWAGMPALDAACVQWAPTV